MADIRKHDFYSSYVAMYNNPQLIVDPTGMSGDTTKVAIDPGHGDKPTNRKWHDPGALSADKKNNEADIALNISNAVSKKLKDEGLNVVQTREGKVTDPGKKLAWRIKKSEGSDIFVSIHINSADNTKASGFQVLHKSSDANAKSLAQSISSASNLFSKNRGTKARDNLYVLNKSKATSVLVEAGFITNSNDLKVMTTKSAEIGGQIATGIINYINKKK